MKKIAAIFLLSLIPSLAGGAGAADPDLDPAPVLTMTVIPAQSVANAGKHIQVMVRLNIASPFHINSNRPADPALIATAFTLPDLPPGIQLLRVDYPPPEKLEIKGEAEPWLVFNDQSILKFSLQIDSAAKPGQYQLRGQLDYQACNEVVCQMPDRQYADFIIHIAKNTHE
ncbi:MAG: protein-disulfide reductase DsbD N-terminal domain-containing protein [Desulfarculales bacterium]|jgi:hypothetical protein|nr:protein-disulfide reductase DsbD N-terminal domain-containing protein [Desulfarculales bacterium]